jgi:hypothetical protein
MPNFLEGSNEAGPFANEVEVVAAAMSLAAQTAVHEILEWTRFRGRQPIETHGDEEPTIHLPPVSASVCM